MSQSLKVIFAGTPDFAASSLQALIDSKHQVVAVYTQPDRPAGRGKKILKSPVKQLAEQAGIEVVQPLNFKNQEDIDSLAAFNADVMVVAAYGLILPQAVLDIPTMGCLNVHASLLPRWRGAAPIQRAIEAGDSESGVTIMQMALGLDTGDMLAKKVVTLVADETGGSLHDKLADDGADLLISTLDDLVTLQKQAEKQNEDQANYAHKLSKQEALLDWSLDAPRLHRKIRAFNPWPVCYLYSEESKDPIRVFEAEIVDQGSDSAAPGTVLEKSAAGIIVQCGTGRLNLTRIQLAGSRAVSARDFFNGGKVVLNEGSVLHVPG